MKEMIKKAKSENCAAQPESSVEDDVEMDETTTQGDEQEPEIQQNGSDTKGEEGGIEKTDQEKQKQEEKESMEKETRNKLEKERADREELKKKRSEEEENKTVFIKGRHTDITKINPRKARKEICDVIGGGFSIHQSRDSLRLVCSRTEQKEKLMNIRTILEHEIIISEPFSLTKARNRPNTNRGIIFGVGDDISDEEMSEELGIKAERIIKKMAGKTIRTAQMILHFEGDLPPYVRFEWKRYRVSTYIPEVIRCYKCQRFGHKAPSCQARRPKCTICSGPHEVQHCPMKSTHREEQTAVCPNCKGSHPASYHGCPEFKLAKEAQKKHILQRISYADAVRRCRQEKEEKTNASKEKPAANQATNVPPSAESTSRPSGESKENKPKETEKDEDTNKYIKNIDIKKITEFIKAIVTDIRTDGTEKPEEVTGRVHALLQKLRDQIYENTRAREEERRGGNEEEANQPWMNK